MFRVRTSTPPKTKTPPPKPKEQTNPPLSTPLSARMVSVAEYGNDWGYASWL